MKIIYLLLFEITSLQTLARRKKEEVARRKKFSSRYVSTYHEGIITAYFLSRYASVSTNFFRVFGFKVGLSGIC